MEEAKKRNYRRERAIKRWQKIKQLRDRAIPISKIAKMIRKENGKFYSEGGIKKALKMLNQYYNLIH